MCCDVDIETGELDHFEVCAYLLPRMICRRVTGTAAKAHGMRASFLCISDWSTFVHKVRAVVDLCLGLGFFKSNIRPHVHIYACTVFAECWNVLIEGNLRGS